MTSSPAIKEKKRDLPNKHPRLGTSSINGSVISLSGVAMTTPPPLFGATSSFMSTHSRNDGQENGRVKLGREPLGRFRGDIKGVEAAASVTDRVRIPASAAQKSHEQWMDMQSVLKAVETSAEQGQQMFGREHELALEGLRNAQIELARAWARSEADEVIESVDHRSRPYSGKGGNIGSDGRTATTAATSGSAARPLSSEGLTGVDGDVATEHELEIDISSARKRREANDRYFKKVNDDVIDVVMKLEEVANAMRAMERENKVIWGDMEKGGAEVTDTQES
ncbi:BgTH12-00661 [Blumeria graminis f. sp. triticale]|uniref:Bgt-3928 n=3 Tax=Blumeria graminis TaxID=34373 RepID=A0A381L8S5_BLUGR|nr:hypothetical protein BGT96224_3928 [Blumeria graminis f. sp. tritici 96224]CAD6505166.1 BgTH12-00661 [Blumeria graminis f. sp. triticale]VDB93172.1 Bgt-3928 [Blumeria graminis f. sp. tritici]